MCVQFVYNNFGASKCANEKCLENVHAQLHGWNRWSVVQEFFFAAAFIFLLVGYFIRWIEERSGKNNKRRTHTVWANKWEPPEVKPVRLMLMLLNFGECFMRILIAWAKSNAKCFIVSNFGIFFGCFAACTNSHSLTHSVVCVNS